LDRIDLHIHTTASDGTDPPCAAAEKAARLGLRAIAVTDHDNASGVEEAIKRGRELGLEVVPGVELSTDWRGHKAHLLGYFIDAASPALAPALNWAVTEREERNAKMVALMQRDGFDISIPDLMEEFPGTVLGRPHMAEHLMRKGYVSSVKEAFNKYLADGMPYCLPKGRLELGRAIDCIKGSGGVAVLAHPLQYGHDEKTLLRLLTMQNFLASADLRRFIPSIPRKTRLLCAALRRSAGSASPGAAIITAHGRPVWKWASASAPCLPGTTFWKA